MTAANISSWESRARDYLLTFAGIELKRKIGEGGAGRTYVGESRPGLPTVARGHHPMSTLVAREHWKARVCCKLIPPDSKLLEYEREGIRRIESIQRRYPHPHLLTLLCFAEIDGGFVEVMELADEVSEHSFQTLEHHIWAETRLKLDEAYTIIRCLAEAAQHLRKYDRRHQDIKPANVVRVGRVWKLADFGAVIIESQSGVEGRLTREPYGPDTAGLARTLYAMLSGEYLNQPCDPLPDDLLPVGDTLHDDLISPAVRESDSIKSPAQFLARLDRICTKGEEEPHLPPAEHVRKLADGMAGRVSNHNRGVLTTLACTALVCMAVAAVSTAASVWWLSQGVFLPPLLALGVWLATVTWYRRAGQFWTVSGLAQWIDGRAGTPNLILSALDYSCGAESGLARAERQVWLTWSCLDATVSFQHWLSDVGSRLKFGCWSLVPRLLQPQSFKRHLMLGINDRTRAVSARRLLEPTSDFAASIVRRADRIFATLMEEIPQRNLLIELLRRWGNRLLGLAVGLLALLILWTACSLRIPKPNELSSSGPEQSERATPQSAQDRPQPDNPSVQPGGSDAPQSPQDELDKKQLAEALRQAEEALKALSRRETQQSLSEAGVNGDSLDSVEKFVAEAKKSLKSGSSGSSTGGGDPMAQAAATQTSAGGTSSSNAGPSQVATETAGGTADQDGTNTSSPTSGQPTNDDGSQSSNRPAGGKSQTSRLGAGERGDSNLNSGQKSNTSQPPGSRSGPQQSSAGSQPPSASGTGRSASSANVQSLAQEAASALQQAKQSLSAAAPSSASGQRATQAAAVACRAAVQSLQALAGAGQTGIATGSNSPLGASLHGGDGGNGGREPGTGTSHGHGGGQAAPLVLDGRVIQIPLMASRGGDLPSGAAKPVNVKPSSLQRRSEGESADAMIVDEHKKRALNAILAPADAPPNAKPPTHPQPPQLQPTSAG